uniref:hypothetical protein n=1 Tax=Amycolatopsis sp. CA-096443 TaxID=3239919 RepID=UPI003F49A6DE
MTPVAKIESFGTGPSCPEAVALAPRLRVAEGRLRRTRRTTEGVIEVVYSPSGPIRSVPGIEVTAALREHLVRAADCLAAGQRYPAEAEFGEYVLLGCGGGALPEQMKIVSYVSGIELVVDDGALAELGSGPEASDGEDGGWAEGDTWEDVPLF